MDRTVAASRRSMRFALGRTETSNQDMVWQVASVAEEHESGHGPYSQEEWASDCTTVTGRPHDESTLCDEEPMIARLVSETSSLLPMITLCAHTTRSAYDHRRNVSNGRSW